MTSLEKKERISLYLPCLYTYISRTRSIKVTLIIYLFYTAGLPMLFIELWHFLQYSANTYLTEVLPEHVAMYLISFFMFFIVYEIGYIYNDIISEKWEGSSTGRLRTIKNGKEVWSSTLFRLSLWTIIVVILDNFTKWGRTKEFIIFNILLLSIFYAHNNIIKPYRIVSIFYLHLFRVLYPLFFLLGININTTIATMIYAIVLSLYNVLTYIGVNYEAMKIKNINIFDVYYYNGKIRTIYFIINILLFSILFMIFFNLDYRMMIIFIFFSLMSFIIAKKLMLLHYKYVPIYK